MKWKPIVEGSKPCKKKKGQDWGAHTVPSPDQVLQQAEWELWRLTTHCGDLSTPHEQLYQELEALLGIRAYMMEMSGMASHEFIVHTVATALAEGGLHMSVAGLLGIPPVAETVTLIGPVPPAPDPASEGPPAK